jgi:hypothetical protein
MAPDSVWEIVFLLVILKIPIVYLCGVIWYAIKAEPKPEAGAAVTVEIGPEADDGGSRRRQAPFRRPVRPHGGPTRTAPRVAQNAYARGERR